MRTTDDVCKMLADICEVHHCSKTGALEKLIVNQHKLVEMGVKLL